jgi:hypothetical protein
MRSTRGAALTVLAALLAAGAPPATPQSVQYAYDDAGRLRVVADSGGDLAMYEYDAVGNLLAIRRIDVAATPEPVAIVVIAPAAARPGATVSLFGKGFAAAADANVVRFNGVRAEVVSASPTRLIVTVPPGAAAGAITVTTPIGSASSPSFRVLGALAITPASAAVAPGDRVTFVASGDGVAAVRWSVDGRVGGGGAGGTITADGVYQAPETPPASIVSITATSVEDPSLHATAHIAVLAARAVFLVARSAVSVGAAAPATSTFVAAAPVGVAVAPIVTRVVPSDGARGEQVRVVVSGVGLADATALTFAIGATPDPALTVTDLVVSADGREATAEVSIAADAAPGARLVRVVTPAGTSATAAADTVFTVH